MDLKKIRINLNNIEDANRFVKIARTFMSDIDIMTERACIDAKSIIGVYALDLSQDVYVRIISDDINEIRRFEMVMEEFR